MSIENGISRSRTPAECYVFCNEMLRPKTTEVLEFALDFTSVQLGLLEIVQSLV